MDQAGFRKSFSTTEHMHTAALLIEKAQEWNSELWIAAVDYAKAFDSVEHASLWNALSSQGVPSGYIRLLKLIYAGQVGKVITDTSSKQFSILRGVRQGDPLSTLLFNAMMESIFRSLKIKWNPSKVGLEMGAVERLTNLRFADDVLLLTDSKKRMLSMLEDLSTESAKHGLHLHPDKSKVITNFHGAGRLKVLNMSIEFLILIHL